MIIKDYKIIRQYSIKKNDTYYQRHGDNENYSWYIIYDDGYMVMKDILCDDKEIEELEAEFQSNLKTKDVVINSSGGGLNFTHSEIMRYAELAGLPLEFVKESLGIDNDEYCHFYYSLNGKTWHIDTDVSRECKHLVEMVKKMNGIGSRDTFKVISIPETTKYHIIYYDGDYEYIKEDIGQKTWDWKD